jgi:hypothetical protein
MLQVLEDERDILNVLTIDELLDMLEIMEAVDAMLVLHGLECGQTRWTLH